MSPAAEEYHASKGVECTRQGCHEPPAEDSLLCPPHLDDERSRQRKSKRRLRKRRRRLGLCQCGRPRPPAKKGAKRPRICVWCQVTKNRLTGLRESIAGQTQNVHEDVHKSERIAAATRMHDDGRARYHGTGKKGKQPDIRLDGQDLGFARAAMEAGEVGLQVYELEVAKNKAKDPEALPRVQREDIKGAALHQLNRAVGHIEDVLERRGHFRDRHGRREGEDE